MQTTVKNLTNGPFDLPLQSGGSVRLPAASHNAKGEHDPVNGGRASGEFEPGYLELLKASLAVEVLHDEHGPAAPAPVADTTQQGEHGAATPPVPRQDEHGAATPPVPQQDEHGAATPPVPQEPSAALQGLRGAADVLQIAYDETWDEAKLMDAIQKATSGQ